MNTLMMSADGSELKCWPEMNWHAQSENKVKGLHGYNNALGDAC